jgi:ribonuclease/clavin/mitogillin
LVDTGEGRDAYAPVLESALRKTAIIANPDQPDISDIVITHRHHDHYNGIPAVLPLVRRLWSERNPNPTTPFKPPRLHKFPTPSPDVPLNNMIKSVPLDAYILSPSGSPWHDLSDSTHLPISFNPDESDAERSILQFIHTPGHTVDSISIYLPLDQALFTADTVLGYGSTVFEDLRSYMASLQKMFDFSQPLTNGNPKYDKLYPGHGPVVKDGPNNIATYIKHRKKRDEQILQAIKGPPPNNEPWTTWSLVSVIYKDYPETLWLAAAHTLDMHLRKLEQEGKVESLGGVGKEVMWEVL